MLVDHSQYDFLYKRASYECYKLYKVNKLELWLLNTLSWMLKHRNRTVIAKLEWFGTITGNARERRKMEGYFNGLLRLGLVGTFEYVSSPGSVSVGLSDQGIAVLKCYDKAIEKFVIQFACSPYKLEDYPHSIIDEPLPLYRRIA